MFFNLKTVIFHLRFYAKLINNFKTKSEKMYLKSFLKHVYFIHFITNIKNIKLQNETKI